MQHSTNAVITDAGNAQRRPHGTYEIILSLPADGGFSIAVHAKSSPHRHNELSFTTPDVDTANLAYRVIAQGADNGVSPDGIRAALDDALRAELHRVQRRHDTPSRQRAEHINALLDLVESPAATDDINALLDFASKVGDTVAAGVSDTDRPKTLAELRDAYRAAAAADRGARKGGVR